MPTTVDVAKLHLQVTNSGLEKSDKGLKSLTKTSRGAEKATDRLRSSVAGLVTKLIALAGSAFGLGKFVSVNRQFEIFNAQLETITGNLAASRGAFRFVSEFAQKTPYDLQKATQAFVILNNFGLESSERALTSYGNTAAAMGKDLTQMIEAVADATTNEFERLKEFGVKAKSEGENVIFTFRGVSTTVKKEAREIEDYLIRLGELNFSGGMERRMRTLDGLISNLGDQFDIFFLRISNLGVGNVLTSALSVVIEQFEALNNFLERDAIVGLQGFTDQVKGVVDYYARILSPLKDLFAAIHSFIRTHFGAIIDSLATVAKAFFNQLVELVKYLPQNLNAFTDITLAIAKGLYAQLMRMLSSFIENIQNRFSLLFSILGVAGEKLKSLMTFSFDVDATTRINALMSTYHVEQTKRERENLQLSQEINAATKEKIALALRERQEAISAFEAKQKTRLADIDHERFEEDAAFKRFRRQEAELQANRRAQKEKEELKRNELSFTADFFGNLAAISSQAGRRQSNLSRRLAIIQTTIKTYEAATSAYSSLAGIPLVGPVLGAAAAAAAVSYGLANVRAIRSASFGGAYDRGGRIAAGQFGLVGERGPELVEGPAQVTSRQETADLLNKKMEVVVMNFFNENDFKAKVASAIAENKEVIVNIIQTEQSHRRL